MMENLQKNNRKTRINLVTDTLREKGKGDFTMVPNCIYEMGLTRVQREVWLYLNRIPVWDNPVVNDMPALLEMGKARLLEAFDALEKLGMIVIEGSGKDRVFHLTSPAHWEHPLPKSIYGAKSGEKAPLDIREKKKTVPNRTKNRSEQNEKPFRTERKTVPNRTKSSRESLDGQGVKTSPKTKQNDTKLVQNWVGDNSNNEPELTGYKTEEHPPTHYDGIIDIVRKVEPWFANPKNGYVPYAPLNAAFMSLPEHLRENFVKHLHECWIENKPTQFLGVGDKRAEDYRLNPTKLDLYLKWFRQDNGLDAH